jgi:hypothetical protein
MGYDTEGQIFLFDDTGIIESLLFSWDQDETVQVWLDLILQKNKERKYKIKVSDY